MSVSGDSQRSLARTYEAVVPTDITRGSHHTMASPPPPPQQQAPKETRSSSESSSGSSMKSPRTARFAEATTIHSPVDQPRSPFADPPKNQVQGNVADVGFGYVNTPAQHADDSRPPLSPFRPDLKVPDTAKSLNPMSPTFREEYMLGKQEKSAEKENARDLVRKSLCRPSGAMI